MMSELPTYYMDPEELGESSDTDGEENYDELAEAEKFRKRQEAEEMGDQESLEALDQEEDEFEDEVMTL